MKRNALLVSLSLLAPVATVADDAFAAGEGGSPQTVTRAGTQPAIPGPADYFTGKVRIEPLFPAKDPDSVTGAYVTFEPGARTAWHIHPAGQHLVVTAGQGWTQAAGGPKVELRPGDVVWCPPGVKHWHGASPNSRMTHMALTESLNGKNVEWLEKVSDAQYHQ